MENKELMNFLANQFEGINKQFEGINVQFSQLDERFSQMDERFSQMDERFSHMDERFNQMDERFNGLENEVKKLGNEFQQFQGLSTSQFDSIKIQIDDLNKKLDIITEQTAENQNDSIYLAGEIGKHTLLINKLNQRIL